ncbi:MAG: Gfo/Idh/MocA family oxidoreductase [Isosphaeraceae bacterium]|nr:Gfo/Idh/MocA family oxidoreductase [Isosphaeraceae bacterium]
MTITRRKFVRTTVAAGLAVAAPAVHAQDKSEKKYNTALIGTGWWGTNIVREALRSGECRLVALCDVDDHQIDVAQAEISKVSADTPKRYKDFRELLDREKPEIVICATPDHWHPLITIAAVKAGAHVCVEKPIGHTINEGKAMVKAARDYDRVVQVGTHRRVSPHNVAGREFLRSGKAGKIGMVRAFVHYGGGPEQPRKNTDPPKGLDWEMWCGPAPLRPYNGDTNNPWSGGIHPRGFRNYLDYANGTLGDWGVHWMDQILWIMDEQAPRKVYSVGGRPIKGPAVLTKDEQTSDAPDHQVSTFEFDRFSVSWEHRQFAGNNAEKGESVGCYFYGTEGTFHMGWQQGWTFYPLDTKKAAVHQEPTLHQPDDQNIRELWADFLGAIKTGKRPVSDIEKIHLSTNMSLLGMLALKLGRGIEWDAEKQRVVGDEAANKLLSRAYRRPWEYPVV